MKRVYLDNAATTPISPEVVNVMLPLLQNEFGNPSSSHSYGRQVKAIIETSRRTIASKLNCLPAEIIFTSGGTEADNMAIYTSIETLGVKRIISSEIEHHAVGHTIEHLKETFGVKLEYVALDEKGNVNLSDLENRLKSDEKTLVSLMHANNEIGTLLPIQDVSEICKRNNALFHCDTVQTVGHLPLDLKELDIDFITCAAHKLHGPKGVGFYISTKKTGHMLLFKEDRKKEV